ncbi:carbon monoxide dehydrogenase subunit G [Alisedimentitalea sp. MJ-SS2]|uniref:CoxG family protein n=1 Tax=Aliisedimentitalea sp. MJ-SS2 TaxID=3049795 RepID=UPI00290DE7A7|nr:carbon monoxide dehydrogenase subunit G [Alisedimentitalea sp. MJ-SS2]MDU8925867.1 carbon monoxide dehydrogenase subunit G [Alisedimentitalea sp. MJ-SS2]
MELSDSRVIAADRGTVWEALLSADVLKECVPGCQEMHGSADDGFEAVVVQKVGPVKATFKGSVTISDRVECESLTLSGQGKGGAAGFAKGGAKVRLEEGDTPGSTVLSYDVEAKVGGKLAQLGSRIIGGFAKKMADQFFTRFQEAVEGPDETEEMAEGEAVEGETKKKGWFKRVISG